MLTMKFFDKGNPTIMDTSKGRLYLFHITFESGMQVVKIGKASGKDSVDRMMQIQRAYFKKNRCTFLCRIKRDRPVEDVFAYETALHHFFADYRYTAKTPFDGSTELFVVHPDAATDVYEYLLEHGVDSLEGMEFDPDAYVEEVDQLPF